MHHSSLKLLRTHSFFLFGARATGKTELLSQTFSLDEAFFIDLLDPELASQLSAYPRDFLNLIEPHRGQKKWITIDEVQKVPQLLELVHQQISQKTFHFALTGSSARKLKRGSANLLAGRAFVFNLFPLTHQELNEDFDLSTYLQFGGLPGIYNLTSDIDKRRLLKAYAQTYLKEEVVAEQIVRNLPPFKRFLDIVGTHTSEVVSYTNIARDIDSDPKSVMRYYEILEDTLLGFYLPSYGHSIRKQQKKAKRFYFFDTGVARVLAGRVDLPLEPKSFEYRQLFKNYIVTEIHRLLSYSEKQHTLSFLRVSENQEIDLIIEKGDKTFLCEIKSAQRADERMAHSLKTLAADFDRPILRALSNDPTPRKFGDIRAVHWKEGIQEIIEA